MDFFFFFFLRLQKRGSLGPVSSEVTGNLADFKNGVSDVCEYHYQTFCVKRDGSDSNQLSLYKTKAACVVCKPSRGGLVRISTL